MPRKIPDLEMKIMNAAGRLFFSHGYLEVSMNMVAAEAGTSVGNLYNYFPAKKDLFLAGRRLWLENLAQDLEDGMGTSEAPFEQLEALLLGLGREMARWGSLWDEFLAVTTRELSKEDLTALKVEMREELRTLVIENVNSLLVRLAPGNPDIEALLACPGHRLASALVSILKSLSMFYPGEMEVNAAFIRLTLRTLCHRPLAD